MSDDDYSGITKGTGDFLFAPLNARLALQSCAIVSRRSAAQQWLGPDTPTACPSQLNARKNEPANCNANDVSNN